MLVLPQCVFRAVQAFSMYTEDCETYYCGTVINEEWYLRFRGGTDVFVHVLAQHHPPRQVPAR